MTNEGKARAISGLCKNCSLANCSISVCYPLLRYNSAMEMAEWKDEQIFDALRQLGYDAAAVAVKQLISADNTKE